MSKDNIIMTDKQLRKLIDGLADQMVKRIYGVGEEQSQASFYADRDEDRAIGELARLMTLSAIYEDREEYEKCAAIKKHIDKINNLIDKYNA
tara:strand:- start:127 stop:402 length:276 start_codon:yes stop_codon:yes gene_type:complete